MTPWQEVTETFCKALIQESKIEDVSRSGPEGIAGVAFLLQNGKSVFFSANGTHYWREQSKWKEVCITDLFTLTMNKKPDRQKVLGLPEDKKDLFWQTISFSDGSAVFIYSNGDEVSGYPHYMFREA